MPGDAAETQRSAGESRPGGLPAYLRRRKAIDYDPDPDREGLGLQVLQASAPGFNYLVRRYPRRHLRRDAIAGVAVAAYLVPQVLAYSAIVNVPPVAGLWTALAAIVAYAVMGGSRVLSAGPESTIALMAGAAISPMAHGDPQRALTLSAGLCLVVAGWCLVARVVRAGVVVELLSQPLLVGYLAGGAVLMIVGQLGKVTGTKVSGETITDQVISFSGMVGQGKLATIAVAAATLLVILLLRWLAPALPAPLIAVALATLASVLLQLPERGVAIVGPVPTGLPMPHLPALTGAEMQALVLAGLGVAVVGFSDNMLIARGFPSPLEEGEPKKAARVDPNSELVAMAGVHVAIGLMSGYPASSSGSRTALAIASGARSQVYSLVAGLCIVAVLYFAGGLLENLPAAALGAVVFYAAGKLVTLPEISRLWKFRRREFFIALVTMLATVFIGILTGVLIAIAISLLEVIHRLARPHEGVLGRVPGMAGMHDVDDYPDAETLPGCIFYRYDAPLFFANIGDLRDRVENLVTQENEAYPDTPVRWFILNVEANVEVDITAADGLRELAEELAARGVELGLARVKLDLYEPLDRAGVVDVIGKDMLFPTLPIAEEAYLRWAVEHAPEPQQPEPGSDEDDPDAHPRSLLPWERPDPDDEDVEDEDDEPSLLDRILHRDERRHHEGSEPDEGKGPERRRDDEGSRGAGGGGQHRPRLDEDSTRG